MISVQMGPQTRLLQNNDTLMLEKIQSSLVNTIPLWKSQMVLALGLEHSRQATAAQSAVTNMTNELLQKNADMLKMGTIETAKEAERSVVDIQTLQHTNQQLISTLDEVMKIQQDGAQKRKEPRRSWAASRASSSRSCWSSGAEAMEMLKNGGWRWSSPCWSSPFPSASGSCGSHRLRPARHGHRPEPGHLPGHRALPDLAVG